LLVKAGLPVSMDKSHAQGGTGIFLTADGEVDDAIEAFVEAVAMHRHFGREMDPPLV
jgi:catalase